MGEDHEYTPVQAQFIEWLKGEGYEPAVEVCPVDNGELLFSTDSWDLVSDFKSAHPEYADVDAVDIVPDDGMWDQVSDFFSDVPEPDIVKGV
jgi:hypothetical protein